MNIGRRSLELLAVPALLLSCLVSGSASDPCKTCHPSESSSFAQSPMGRSLGFPSVLTAARLVHKLSDSTLTVQPHGAALEHTVEHRGLTATYPAAYSVGAGIVGYSYMVWIGQYLFQSPISYYTQTKTWDLTPGYETETNLDFTHQITTGCLFCHTGSVNLTGTVPNQFANPPFTAISCERCHGPSAAHLKNPGPGSIVNPAKLAPAQRDSVCEQCHLEGEIRILNPGRDWWDIQTGQPTQSVFATYLRTVANGTLRAVSQSELLAESQCARQSGGRLWCGTCHSAHAANQNRTQAVREVCLSCHKDLFVAKTHPAADECVSCHMPRLHATNVAHAAVTDHRIPRRPHPQDSGTAGSQADLKAWRDPDAAFRDRDLGLAYFNGALSKHSDSDLKQAYAILSKLAPAQRQDPAVESSLASILLQQDQRPLALELFARAAAQEPSNARYAYCMGAAFGRTGKTTEAMAELRRSIRLDPAQPQPYLELAALYRKAGQTAEARRVIQEYLRFMPQNLRMRLLN